MCGENGDWAWRVRRRTTCPRERCVGKITLARQRFSPSPGPGLWDPPRGLPREDALENATRVGTLSAFASSVRVAPLVGGLPMITHRSSMLPIRIEGATRGGA